MQDDPGAFALVSDMNHLFFPQLEKAAAIADISNTRQMMVSPANRSLHDTMIHAWPHSTQTRYMTNTAINKQLALHSTRSFCEKGHIQGDARGYPIVGYPRSGAMLLECHT